MFRDQHYDVTTALCGGIMNRVHDPDEAAVMATAHGAVRELQDELIRLITTHAIS
jgi:hypothetical protein